MCPDSASADRATAVAGANTAPQLPEAPLPHPTLRPSHTEASRNQARKPLKSHHAESTVKPTDIPKGTTRAIGHTMLIQKGWSETQWPCLDKLWTRESDWRVYAANPSGAYGIPQSLPGNKMSMMGSDWRTNPVTQIRWGLYYIAHQYGTPCDALAHSYAYNYY